MKILPWWFAISLPANRDRSTPIERRRCRYEELTSSFVFFLTACFIPMFPVMFFFSPKSPSAPPTSVVAFFVLVLAFISGRVRKQRLSAVFVLIYVTGMVATPVATNPTQPLVYVVSYSFVFAIMLAGALIEPRASIVMGVLLSAFLVAVVFVEPHPVAYMAIIGSYTYSVMVCTPILIFLLVGVSMSIILTQLNTTIMRADRAEEIVHLQSEIAAFELRRKMELSQVEAGVQVIAEAHQRFATGDVSVRIPGEVLAKFEVQNAALARIAFSLNMLFSRVQRWREEGMLVLQTETAIAQIVEQLPAAADAEGVLVNLPERTGTLLDPLLLELKSTARRF